MLISKHFILKLEEKSQDYQNTKSRKTTKIDTSDQHLKLELQICVKMVSLLWSHRDLSPSYSNFFIINKILKCRENSMPSTAFLTVKKTKTMNCYQCLALTSISFPLKILLFQKHIKLKKGSLTIVTSHNIYLSLAQSTRKIFSAMKSLNLHCQ